MKPTVYIETTIPRLLTAWPSRDVEILAQQIATREWWEKRGEYELCISEEVLREAGGGDADAAAPRLLRGLVGADVRRLRSFPPDHIGQPSPQSFDQSLVTSAATNTATRFHHSAQR